MTKARGREHTTLTETAQTVVRELKKIPGIKMIAPGEIKVNSKKGSGKRFLTCVYTNAGFELLISGQSIQKISVHTEQPEAIYQLLKNTKSLKDFVFKSRERKPEQ